MNFMKNHQLNEEGEKKWGNLEVNSSIRLSFSFFLIFIYNLNTPWIFYGV